MIVTIEKIYTHLLTLTTKREVPRSPAQGASRTPVSSAGKPSFRTGSSKQVRIIKKADRWYASINIQCDVDVPNPMPHGETALREGFPPQATANPKGHPTGVDIGLKKFLATTSDGVLVKPPKLLLNLQSELKNR